MSERKLHTYNDTFESSVARTYKCCRLVDTEGTLLVSYNYPKMPIREKLKEISRKIKILPDGIYNLQCQYTHNKNVSADNLLIKKGNVTLSEHTPLILDKVTTNKTVQKNSHEELTSLTGMLSRIEELAILKAENMVLKNRITALEKEVTDLEEELEEAEEGMNEEGGGLDSLFKKDAGGDSPFKQFAELIPSLSDSYFKMKDREHSLKEKEIEKKYNGHSHTKTRFIKKRKEENGQMEMTKENVLQYMDALERLNDKDFDEEVQRIAEVQPELFDLVCQEFNLDENGQPNEEEEEEEEEEK